jgi:hypothetical protein
MKTQHDSKLIRCPKLGDEMMFGYCVQESGDLPCARIIRCWQAAFDVEAVLKEHLTALQWKQFNSAQPKDKVISLIEIIEAAKAKK